MDEYIHHLLESEKESRAYISATNIKDRFLYPFLPTIIIDNFFESPQLVRDFALDQNFYKGERGSWPGLRSDFITDLNPELFNFITKKIFFVMRDYNINELYDIQLSFQLIDGSWGTGWVHDDDPKLNLAGVIYLNKDAPTESGTTLYEDAADFNPEIFSDMFMKDVFSENVEERKTFIKYREEQRSYFKPSVKINNIYNRCILFDTRNWHSANNFFGDSKENTRLTICFFCKIR